MATLDRHRRAAYLLMLLLSITLSTAVALTLSGFAFVNGGIPSVYKIWTERPQVNEGYPLPALALGIPIGIVSGYHLWAWLIKRFNVLTDDEFAKYKDSKKIG
ncbi:MAG: hypothetical protein H8K11_11065 [Nitrospira sp.]|nr:hypothetical protein [Nitrospira sp.]